MKRPVELAGFEISFSPGGNELLVGPGRFSSDEFIVENENGSRVNIDEISEGHHGPREGVSHLVYLDVWRRYFPPGDGPGIGEVALGGPDTGTRIETGWDVLVLIDERDRAPFDASGVSCDDPIDLWDRLTADSGQMSARARPNDGATDPDSEAGYHGAENRFYRVEIHDPGPRGVATFKWSWEDDPDRDAPTSIGSTPLGIEFLELEQGVEVEFNDDCFSAGDYWIVPAPMRPGRDGGALEVLPRGARHRFVRLALVTWGKGVTDCRPAGEKAD